MTNALETNSAVKAEDLTIFLVEQTGTCLGCWSGKMSKKQQLESIGVYLGKGLIVINGEQETITHVVKVCFGTDTAWTAQYKFDGTKTI